MHPSSPTLSGLPKFLSAHKGANPEKIKLSPPPVILPFQGQRGSVGEGDVFVIFLGETHICVVEIAVADPCVFLAAGPDAAISVSFLCPFIFIFCGNLCCIGRPRRRDLVRDSELKGEFFSLSSWPQDGVASGSWHCRGGYGGKVAQFRVKGLFDFFSPLARGALKSGRAWFAFVCVRAGAAFFVVGPNFVKDGPVFSVLVRNIFWWEIRLLRFVPSFLHLFDFLSAF